MWLQVALTLLLASCGHSQPVDQPEASPADFVETEVLERIPEGFEVVDVLYIPKVVQEPEDEAIDDEMDEEEQTEGEDEEGDLNDWFGSDLLNQIETNQIQTGYENGLVRSKRSPWEHFGGCGGGFGCGRGRGRGFGRRRRRRFRNRRRRPKIIIEKVVIVQQQPIVHKPVPYKKHYW